MDEHSETAAVTRVQAEHGGFAPSGNAYAGSRGINGTLGNVFRAPAGKGLEITKAYDAGSREDDILTSNPQSPATLRLLRCPFA
jgi:hypothetical protein